MSAKHVYGLGPQSQILVSAFTDTTPQVSKIVPNGDYDGLGLQLIVDYQVDAVTLNSGDAVVASTGVWTFGNYTFTGLTGAKLVVSGAAHPGNNGIFDITSVSADTATTATTGLVNETFGAGVVVSVIRSETASVPAGAWTIEVSNNYTAPGNGGVYGQNNGQGCFSDATSIFDPAAVTDAGSQFVQNRLDSKVMRVTFTPSAGLGTATAQLFAKSWS